METLKAVKKLANLTLTLIWWRSRYQG
jgi:hypothetical protein